MKIQQAERLVTILSKYAMTPEDAAEIAALLAPGVEAPVAIQAADLAALIRPKRPPRPPDPEIARRRAMLRQDIDRAFQGRVSNTFVCCHHKDDADAVVSAVQYRCKKAGLRFTMEKASPKQTHFFLTHTD